MFILRKVPRRGPISLFQKPIKLYNLTQLSRTLNGEFMNIIQLAGHLGSDPEERFLANGQKVVTFRIATSDRRGGKDEAMWWRVTIWGDRFDRLLPYLKKGKAAIVIGEFTKAETYVDKNGEQQVSLNVTAEMIRFSPFGRTDRPEGEGGVHGAAAGGTSAGPAQKSGVGDYSLGGNTDFAQVAQTQEEEVPF